MTPFSVVQTSMFSAAENSLQISMGSGSTAVKLFLLMTVLSFATAIVISVTSFTRLVIVFSFLRQALGTPALPPNQVITSLALAMSAFIMAPTATKVYDHSLSPYLEDKIDGATALSQATEPIRDFLLRQTRAEDLRLFYEVAQAERPTRADSIPLTIAIPAFMVSELTTAFRMGLFLFIPLVLIDLLVAAILMALGMMMVPPSLISMPLKIGVFLLADGWRLVVSSLLKSF